MDLTQLIDALHNDYVPTLAQAFARQNATDAHVAHEITVRSSTGRLYTIDIAFTADGRITKVVEVQGMDRLYPGATAFTYGPMELQFDATAWDAMHFSPAPPITDHTAIDDWTVWWMDIDALHRTDAAAPLDGIIHDFGWRDDGSFDVDFGSSPPDAIFALLTILVDEGTTHLDISTARLPPR